MKPNFDKAQNTATELLLQQDINSLYIDVRDLKLPDFIIIESMQKFCAMTGFSLSQLKQNNDGACVVKRGGYRIILYDDQIQNEQRKHWGIVHEVGHALLRHDDDERNSEIEAHFFAAQIVAPEIVLWDICKRQGGSLYAFELLDYFNLSAEAATKRIQTLKRRCGYNNAPIDKLLLEKFTPVLEREFSFHQAS